jgi:hypothetical protein
VHGNTGTTNGITTITLNMDDITDPNGDAARAAAVFGGSMLAELSGIMTHEGTHGIQERAHGMPQSRSQEFGYELQAYRNQALLNMGLHNESSFWSRRPEIDMSNMLRGTQVSTTKWCIHNPRCGN